MDGPYDNVSALISHLFSHDVLHLLLNMDPLMAYEATRLPSYLVPAFYSLGTIIFETVRTEATTLFWIKKTGFGS